jgi:hypothetical protein
VIWTQLGQGHPGKKVNGREKFRQMRGISLPSVSTPTVPGSIPTLSICCGTLPIPQILPVLRQTLQLPHILSLLAWLSFPFHPLLSCSSVARRKGRRQAEGEPCSHKRQCLRWQHREVSIMVTGGACITDVSDTGPGEAWGLGLRVGMRAKQAGCHTQAPTLYLHSSKTEHLLKFCIPTTSFSSP